MQENDIVSSRYKLLRRLGSGGMSEVWVAEDGKLGRQVAIKILQDRLLDSEDLRNRFLREASLTARLSHPNIVPVFDQGILDNKPYIVMEYIPGKTLAQRAQEEMDEEETVRLFNEILEGVEAAHKEGIIHRDLKPDNILIDQSGRARIFDFGVARAKDLGPDTEAGTIIGTARYLSPEQAHGEEADERSDLYSIGIMLYEILAGRTPWEGSTGISALVQQSTEPAAPPSLYNKEVSQKLDHVTLRAIAYRQDLRFQSAEEFRQALLGRETPVKKPWKWLFLLLVPLLAAGWWYQSGLRTVPNLEGKTLLEARNSLFKEDLRWFSKNSPSSKPKGTILLSSPDAGTSVRKGDTIILFISSGPDLVEVPQLKGLSLQRAEQLLELSGLRSRIVLVPSATEAGIVLSSSPLAGEEVAARSEILLRVSQKKTEASRRPPDCISLSEDECYILAEGWNIETDPVFSEEPEGTVVRQAVLSSDTLLLFVSQGPIEVPNLLGQTLADAQDTLAANSLGSIVQYRQTDNPEEQDIVLRQSPLAGKEVPGGEVLLIVGASQ